jgi:hypothetical protein
LEQWHTPPDNKLTAFRWADGHLVNHRYKAKSVAKERHLYSLERSKVEPNVQVERDFLGPYIDDPAAVVHAKLLSQGVSNLTRDEKMSWSPFLISLMLRAPAMVAHLRKRGREILSAGLDEAPDEYLAARGSDPEASLREWVEKHQPDLLDDLGVMTLPRLAQSTKLNLAVLNVTWAIRAVGRSRFDLLIGDRPLILAGSFETSFLLALPLSPRRMFFAFNDSQTFENVKAFDETAFVRAANVSAVSSAERYVYAPNAVQEPLVKKLLHRR